MKYKHFGHSSNNTIRRKFCKVAFDFWPPGGGGGAKTGLNARPPFLSLYMGKLLGVFF